MRSRSNVKGQIADDKSAVSGEQRPRIYMQRQRTFIPALGYQLMLSLYALLRYLQMLVLANPSWDFLVSFLLSEAH